MEFNEALNWTDVFLWIAEKFLDFDATLGRFALKSA
jgi:hypothetical protein